MKFKINLTNVLLASLMLVCVTERVSAGANSSCSGGWLKHIDAEPSIALPAAYDLSNFGGDSSKCLLEIKKVLPTLSPRARGHAYHAIGLLGRSEPDAIRILLEGLKDNEKFKSEWYYINALDDSDNRAFPSDFAVFALASLGRNAHRVLLHTALCSHPVGAAVFEDDVSSSSEELKQRAVPEGVHDDFLVADNASAALALSKEDPSPLVWQTLQRFVQPEFKPSHFCEDGTLGLHKNEMGSVDPTGTLSPAELRKRRLRYQQKVLRNLLTTWEDHDFDRLWRWYKSENSVERKMLIGHLAGKVEVWPRHEEKVEQLLLDPDLPQRVAINIADNALEYVDIDTAVLKHRLQMVSPDDWYGRGLLRHVLRQDGDDRRYAVLLETAPLQDRIEVLSLDRSNFAEYFSNEPTRLKLYGSWLVKCFDECSSSELSPHSVETILEHIEQGLPSFFRSHRYTELLGLVTSECEDLSLDCRDWLAATAGLLAPGDLRALAERLLTSGTLICRSRSSSNPERATVELEDIVVKAGDGDQSLVCLCRNDENGCVQRRQKYCYEDRDCLQLHEVRKVLDTLVTTAPEIGIELVRSQRANLCRLLGEVSERCVVADWTVWVWDLLPDAHNQEPEGFAELVMSVQRNKTSTWDIVRRIGGGLKTENPTYWSTFYRLARSGRLPYPLHRLCSWRELWDQTDRVDFLYHILIDGSALPEWRSCAAAWLLGTQHYEVASSYLSEPDILVPEAHQDLIVDMAVRALRKQPTRFQELLRILRRYDDSVDRTALDELLTSLSDPLAKRDLIREYVETSEQRQEVIVGHLLRLEPRKVRLIVTPALERHFFNSRHYVVPPAAKSEMGERFTRLGWEFWIKLRKLALVLGHEKGGSRTGSQVNPYEELTVEQGGYLAAWAAERGMAGPREVANLLRLGESPWAHHQRTAFDALMDIKSGDEQIAVLSWTAVATLDLDNNIISSVQGKRHEMIRVLRPYPVTTQQSGYIVSGPRFPWPPPVGFRVLPVTESTSDSWLIRSDLGTESDTLQHVADNLESALFRIHNTVKPRYFRLSEGQGFAMLVGIQKINSTGDSIRWLPIGSEEHYRIGSVRDYFVRLFTNHLGYFRAVFIVLADAPPGVPAAVSDTRIPEPLLGQSELMKSLGTLPFADFEAYAIIFSFQRRLGGALVPYLEVGGRTHLKSSGLREILDRASG